jgi:WD40 repeat protein
MVSRSPVHIDENIGCPTPPLFFVAGLPSYAITDDFPEVAMSEWDVATGRLIHYFKGETTGPGPAPSTDSLSVSYDGRFVAVVRSRSEGVPDQSVTVWDIPGGHRVYETLAVKEDDPVRSVFFSSDGKYLAFVRPGRVEVYSYDSP